MDPKIRQKILEGMILTRAVDNTLKRMFMSGEMGFQGKGFRSLGQEAIYAAGIALQETGRKILIAPMIRDLGVVLALTDDDVALAINAQAGRAGPPFDGRDLHVGDLKRGVLPPAAPLAIGTCTLVGMALAMKLKGEDGIAVSFMGDGGTSLGEWHEAINFASVQKLPMIFCVENNQIALSTQTNSQSAAKRFADKALGYGMPAKTVDGSDPVAIYEAFQWAAKNTPAMIELECMRLCGHAHHDDMLYLGHEPKLSFEIPNVKAGGYVDKKAYGVWRKKDYITLAGDTKILQEKATNICEKAIEEVKARAWPVPVIPAQAGIQSGPRLEGRGDNKPHTYLEAIGLAVQEILESNPKAYVLGEDVAPPYGNAFMLFKNISKELWPQFINTPISENAIIGSCVGMALEGMLPIAEMQFNDFVASGFNQLVNNAAKFRYRTGTAAPFILRMPYGGLRHAGPYHSQDTSPWFYRTPGLNIAVPSTPSDARALLHAARRSLDPVLFYEHIALYRDPALREELSTEPLEFGKAALRKAGSKLTVISYGAYVHRAMRALESLDCDVIDLRTLVPLDFDAIRQSIEKTGRVLLVGEDSKRGSVLESIASQIAEQLFEYLDAPVRVLGSKNTPVPYSPPLEDAYLVSEAEILNSALKTLEY